MARLSDPTTCYTCISYIVYRQCVLFHLLPNYAQSMFVLSAVVPWRLNIFQRRGVLMSITFFMMTHGLSILLSKIVYGPSNQRTLVYMLCTSRVLTTQVEYLLPVMHLHMTYSKYPAGGPQHLFSFPNY